MSSTFTHIQRDSSQGRWVDLHFLNAKNMEVVVHLILIPSASNIIISSEGKKISLNRPKELPQFLESQGDWTVRPLEDVIQKWSQFVLRIKESPQSRQKNQKGMDQDQRIKKIEKAINNIQKDLESKNSKQFDVFARLLRVSQKQAEKDFPQYYDPTANPFKLSDEYFQKHKTEIKKMERTRSRLEDLDKELKVIKSMTDKEYLESQKSKERKASVDLLKFKEVSINTRRFQLADDLVAYFGKSAEDNLKLLRLARSWNYWFHIKDVPSSHMLVFCSKNRNLKSEEIQKAVFWFVQKQPALSRLYQSGDFVEILMASCGHVRSLKGAPRGHVTYSHEKRLRFKIP